MRRFYWHLVDIASRLLEADERDAVRGDLTESGESGGHALRGVLGLVVRRQAGLWKDWRPWLVLVGLIVPLGMALSIASKLAAGRSATYLWLYVNNWDWALLRHAEFWYELRDSTAAVLAICLPLICWSWTTGFVLGSRSRRVVPVYGALLGLTLAFGVLLGAPRYLEYLVQYTLRPEHSDASNPVDAVAFYREMLPLLVQVLLVAAPAVWGIRQGARSGRFPRWVRLLIGSAACTALLMLVLEEPGFVFFLKAFWLQGVWQTRPMRLLGWVVYWPVGYALACSIRLMRRTA
jgi:hypothetical protein